MDDTEIGDILDESPNNWGRWGDDDEIGALNFLTAAEVLRGAASVERGKTFTLGIPISSGAPEPVTPKRGMSAHHYMKRDQGHYLSGKADASQSGEIASADDVVYLFIQGSTHFDALGHVWHDNRMYNGYDADSTMGGLEVCSIRPIAERGVAGRGILLDIARHRGVSHLEDGERITLDELKTCADSQDTDIHQRDILFLRTGWIESFYQAGEPLEDFNDPGLTYSPELCEWFHEMEIPLLGTDTLGNEQTYSETTGTMIPLHGALLRNQGVIFNEINDLGELAADCASDGKYDFFYVCGPLKIEGGSGSPVNPLAIK